MLLEPQDARLFFKLHRNLMHFVSQRLEIGPKINSPAEFADLPPELGVELRDALTDHIDLIDHFTSLNPTNLPQEELEIISGWKHQISGTFYIFRYLKKYTVFLSPEKQPVAYGVLALSQPFEELVGPYLPVMTKTVLFPFKNRIVYDGLLNSYPISFGPGIRRSLNESCKEAKAHQGIVTSLHCARVQIAST